MYGFPYGFSSHVTRCRPNQQQQQQQQQHGIGNSKGTSYSVRKFCTNFGQRSWNNVVHSMPRHLTSLVLYESATVSDMDYWCYTNRRCFRMNVLLSGITVRLWR